ncbi:transglycosylase SLT domain-containing protein [Nitrincola tapanii]|uniref:Lytic murein transglycosylase n=1 Tax=Nitrincola tapanii TaxID=1708751 RepID=A0A5A9W5V3_9GAMM|nr:transglycosylase SLT domain-containing protein [Nitrincola tapanii]KAA0875824.1 hypothetical protein E1H14_03830 [Nitrincola tapanii]
MKFRKLFSTLAAGVLLSACAQANMSREAQRELYLNTLAAGEAGRLEAFEQGLAQLHDYPLRPYLTFTQDRNLISRLKPAELESLVASYADSPLGNRLLGAYTTQMGMRQNWSDFRYFYSRLKQPSSQQSCYAALADLADGQTAQAWQQAQSLWTQGQSQHSACDPLFEAWIAAGQLTPTIAFERLLLALEAGNQGIARYTERFITRPEDKAHLALIWQVYERPASLAKNPQQLSKQIPHHRRLALLATERYAQQDLEAALESWIQLRDRLEIPAPEQEALASKWGVRFAKRFPDNGLDLLARLDPGFDFAEVTEWRIRLALVQENWPLVRNLIQQLPDNLQQNGRWIYWGQVAANRLGETADPAALQRLMTERSYYGFKAAELNGQPFSLNHKPGNFSAAELQRVAQIPAMQRMYELYRLGDENQARSEWNHLSNHLSQDEVHAAAYVVKSWNWYFQAIRGAIAADRWDDLELRFPAPYAPFFAQATQEFEIEPAWALAVTRQESAFLEVARSGVGARGLMQLMPATARETATRYGIPLSNLERLNEPEVNIRLGSAYLAQMQRQFNGNRVLATAAYNAGPGRVRQWMQARGHLPLDIWIETIPFDETRTYVQNVLSFGVIYNQMAGQSARVFNDQERTQLAWAKPNPLF